MTHLTFQCFNEFTVDGPRARDPAVRPDATGRATGGDFHMARDWKTGGYRQHAYAHPQPSVLPD